MPADAAGVVAQRFVAHEVTINPQRPAGLPPAATDVGFRRRPVEAGGAARVRSLSGDIVMMLAR